MQVDHLYSTEEVAKLFGLKTTTVARRAAASLWPHVRLPGYGGGYRYVFTEAQLAEILDMMTVTVPRAAKKASAGKGKAS